MLLVAWALGGPVFGALSDRLGRRKPLYVAGMLGVALAWALVLQPSVGWVLDRLWTGSLRDGERLYDLAAYRAGFGLMMAWLVVSLVLVPLTRETHCRQQEGPRDRGAPGARPH
jgi:MFS family permease